MIEISSHFLTYIIYSIYIIETILITLLLLYIVCKTIIGMKRTGQFFIHIDKDIHFILEFFIRVYTYVHIYVAYIFFTRFYKYRCTTIYL